MPKIHIRTPFLFVFALLLMLIAPHSLAAQPTAPDRPTAPTLSVIVEAAKDNTLYDSPAGALSNGTGQHFFVGTSGGNQIRRGVLAFDVEGALPLGTQLVSATLQLNMSRTSAGPVGLNLHRLTANWGEGTSDASGNEGGGALSTTGDATWLHSFYTNTLWTTPGGDFVAQPSASQQVDAIAVYTWTSPQLLADVQGWLTTPADNFGWILIGNEGSSTTAKRFDSRQSPTAPNRPKLILTYALPYTIYLPQVVRE
jgi:hypothetical protein